MDLGFTCKEVMKVQVLYLGQEWTCFTCKVIMKVNFLYLGQEWPDICFIDKPKSTIEQVLAQHMVIIS